VTKSGNYVNEIKRLG